MCAMNLRLKKGEAYERIVNGGKVYKIARAAARGDPRNLGPRQMVQVEGPIGPEPLQLNLVVLPVPRDAILDLGRPPRAVL